MCSHHFIYYALFRRTTERKLRGSLTEIYYLNSRRLTGKIVRGSCELQLFFTRLVISGWSPSPSLSNLAFAVDGQKWDRKGGRERPARGNQPGGKQPRWAQATLNPRSWPPTQLIVKWSEWVKVIFLVPLFFWNLCMS